MGIEFVHLSVFSREGGVKKPLFFITSEKQEPIRKVCFQDYKVG